MRILPTIPPWLRVAIGAQCGLLIGMGLGRFSYTPMVPALIASGNLSEAEAGYVGAINLGGYLLGGLSVPWLLRRADRVAWLRAAICVSVLCLLASIVPGGFLWLAFWRGLIGIAVAVIMILGISSVTATAPAGRTGLANAVAYTGVGLGILLSAAGLPWLLAIGEVWAWSTAAFIGLAALAIALWAWSGPAAEAARRIPAPPAGLGAARGDGLRLVVAQGLFAVGLVPHSIYWVDYLIRSLGWSAGAAGAQWVLFGAAAIAGTLVWGRIGDRIGFRPALVAVYLSLALGAVLPVLVTAAPAILASTLLVGAQPGLTAIIAGQAQKIMGPGSMLGLWRWMVLSVGAAQLVGGYALVALFNATGSYLAVFGVGGLAFAAGAVLVAGLKAGRA
ncbi:YbfB/YjiJ family MFS transporter [Thalassobaculum sp. OXR-137]|uniref:YbfB/YjiJ family MFS transporter n=1 Tax=Thalassobaculum sp. OXR-137 TaxID=3100173 RepID=UPI002AC8B644|nr:YbfB/YjiJ family MFS transporter [Thalassobaculum sp. OXR-137]WPZ34704.1 YbfB/YjiJ family MFS transporter [Thalassobaculum sp. OXR-137]